MSNSKGGRSGGARKEPKTLAEVYRFAEAEIRTYGHDVKKYTLEFSKIVPNEGMFCAFFYDPRTKKALCRQYVYDRDKPSVWFVEIANFEILRFENPALVAALLENGRFLYRNSTIMRVRARKRIGGNVISLYEDKLLSGRPL